MRNVYAIMKKELRSYFTSPVAYVVTAAFLVVVGAFFAVIIAATRQASLTYLFGNMSVILMLISPVLTMRLLAEEQSSGTIELLLTSPVRDFEVVLGKYLGALVFLLFMLGITLYYPLLLYIFGQPDLGPMLSGYLGILLQGAVFVAVGMLASSLTRNQIVAAALAFVALLVLWLMQSFASLASPALADIVTYISIPQHFNDFSLGVIDTRDLVYHVSAVTIALFLSVRSLETRRWR
jgi:ABC-2 type transport system permease protein